MNSEMRDGSLGESGEERERRTEVDLFSDW
jgi:hypothetical protein